ncbi:CU044_5270 family protein [Actinocrispum sp. NPDC049592]|uniref:CU044_5270 family protein n=1 Tax=Actinocrispum sp. NPDC049592 TaxID=3154835 RepID=UPI003431B760
MDELQLLRELGDETPLVSAQDLAPARAKLVAGMKPKRGNRFAVYGAAVVGLAAAIFAVFALIPPSKDGSGPAPAAASAETVLRSAAQAARSQPFVEPRPDQFVYTRISYPGQPDYESWLSVDGTRDGRIITEPDPTPIPVAGCRDGRAAIIKGDKPIPGKFEACKPDPAFIPDFPTTTDAMLAYLNKNHSGHDGDTNAMGKDTMHYMMSYLRPASRAALYEAIGRIKGLKLDEHAKDPAGRPAIKISWDFEGRSGGFLLDPKTYAFLGYDDSGALTALSLVDSVGQRP